jgi:transcriptional regulator with XRE-family HTH domain
MKRSATRRRGERQAKEDDDGIAVDVTKLRVLGRGITTGKRYGLRTLREASDLTQVAISERMGMKQSQISKVEAGADHLVSTLRRYAEALGGELDVAIVLGGRRYRLAFADDTKQNAPQLECAEPPRKRLTRERLLEQPGAPPRRR